MIDPVSVRIERIEEFRIAPDVREQLRELLHSCFPDYFATRFYAKQMSTCRLLAWGASELVAQCAIEHRVVSINGNPQEIFGIADLCVRKRERSNGLGTRLIEMIEQLAIDNGINCLMVFADDHRIYERAGYKRHDCLCRWLGVDEHKSLEVLNRRMGDCFMIKWLNGDDREPEEVDLLGYVF